jgi:N-methylhydantoinase A
LSGPAGGVVAALECAREAGYKRVISFDMGGTSTDVSLLDNAIGITTDFDLDGLPIKIPMVDVHTVGAGGGSIANVDEGGALQVGPESAGSNPGPVCYGKGNRPTITDANLMLGRMRADNFLGGRQRLDVAKTEITFGKLAGRLGMDRVVLADGVVRIAISNMNKAIRKISVEKGFDPRDFALVAYGGAGPMHACELAEASLISTVIIPPVPGVFSALGMTLADVVKDYSHSVSISSIKELTINELGELFAPLEMQAGQDLKNEGFNFSAISLKRMLDLRYAGQSFELTIEIDDSMNCPDDFIERFHRTHKDRYGFESSEERIEAIAFRIRATGPRNKPDESKKQGSTPAPVGPSHQPTPKFVTKAYFGEWMKTLCFDRSGLVEGSAVSGPSIVFQLDTTTVVPPGWAGLVDRSGNIILRRTGD